MSKLETETSIQGEALSNLNGLNAMRLINVEDFANAILQKRGWAPSNHTSPPPLFARAVNMEALGGAESIAESPCHPNDHSRTLGGQTDIGEVSQNMGDCRVASHLLQRPVRDSRAELKFPAWRA